MIMSSRRARSAPADRLSHSLVTRRQQADYLPSPLPKTSPRRAAVLAGNPITARFKDALRLWASALAPVLGTALVVAHDGCVSSITVSRPSPCSTSASATARSRSTVLFPTRFYHLIDPAHESLAHMQRLARRLRCRVHPVALGDHEGTAMLEVRADIQESTLLEEVGPRRVRRHDRVPLRRFDMLFGPIMRPSLCKIDVQGAEQMVLGRHDRPARRDRRADHRDQHHRHRSGRRRNRRDRPLPDGAWLCPDGHRRPAPPACSTVRRRSSTCCSCPAAPRRERRGPRVAQSSAGQLDGLCL